MCLDDADRGRHGCRSYKTTGSVTARALFRALYFAAVVWIAFALFLGGWVSSALLRLVV